MATENNGYTGDRRPDNGSDGTPPSGSENLGDITRGQGADNLSDRNWEDIDRAVGHANDAEPDGIGAEAIDHLSHILDRDERGDDNTSTFSDQSYPDSGNTGNTFSDDYLPENGSGTSAQYTQPDLSGAGQQTDATRTSEGDLPGSGTSGDTPGPGHIEGPEGSAPDSDGSFFNDIDTEGRVSDDEAQAIDDAFRDMDLDNDRDLDLDDENVAGDSIADSSGLDNASDASALGAGGTAAADALNKDDSSTSNTKDAAPDKGDKNTGDKGDKNTGEDASRASDTQDTPASPDSDNSTVGDTPNVGDKDPSQSADGAGDRPDPSRGRNEQSPETQDGRGGNGRDSDGNNTTRDANNAPTDSRLGGTDGGRGLETGAPVDPVSPFDLAKKDPVSNGDKNTPRTPKRSSLMPLAGAVPALGAGFSPFGDKAKADPADGADAASGETPSGDQPGTDVAKGPSPFDDAKVMDGIGDGGGGIDPSKNVPARRRDNSPETNDGGGGGGGKPPTGGGPPPALPPGGDDDGEFLSPMNAIKRNPAVFIFIALVLVLALVMLLITNTVNTSNQQNAGPMVCGMDSQKEAFKSGSRGVPDGEFSKPAMMPTGVFTSGYGERWGSMHEGDDIADADNSELFAFEDGVVTHSGSASGYGHWIIINHFGGDEGDFDTLYGHMYADDLFVNVGDEVKAGEVIALMGNDGGSTGTHLHFEVHEGGYRNPINPREWVESAVNPGETSSRQDLDSIEGEDDANANSSTRTFTGQDGVHTVTPMTDEARSVQGGSPDIIKNPQRTFLLAGEEYEAPKGEDNERQLDATMKYTMEDAHLDYVDAWWGYDEYENSPAYHGDHVYYHGRWDGDRFIYADEDLRHNESSKKDLTTASTRGGIQEAIEYLKELNDPYAPPAGERKRDHFDNNGRIVVSVTDLKRYKPDYMPYHPDPGPKPADWVPWDDRNWVDEGWFVDGEWVPNPWYVPTAKHRNNVDKQHPGWRDVGREEIEELVRLAEENDVELFLVTGPGDFGVFNDPVDTDGDNNHDYIWWAVEQGLIDEENIVDWGEFAYTGEYKQGDDEDKKTGGLKHPGAQKYVDSIRVVAWDEDRSKLPNRGAGGFEYGKDSKLPTNEYESPYRDTKYKGNRKMVGYEGGYKIADGKNLTHDAMALAQAIQEQFPEVQTIGGWRASDPYPDHPSGRAVDVMIPDHPSGRAVDVMIPDYRTTRGKNLGKEINQYVLDNADFFNVEYTIWAQEYFPANGNSSKMEDRGSDTQNHYDHVHVTINPPADQNKGDAKNGPKNSYGYFTADESYYYGPFPERDGSPMKASDTAGFSTCCPATGGQTGNNDSGNFASAGNVIGLDEAMIQNSAVVIEAGRELGKSDNEIIVALMTVAGESNFLNYANDGANWTQSGSSNVPPEVLRESLNYPHDAVGHDAASVGIFQQQVGFWGTVADLMIPAYQTGQFYAEMENKNAGDETFGDNDRGLAAATIQVNQPGRAAYDVHEGLAVDLLQSYDGESPLSNTDKEHLNRGYDNRKNGTSSTGEDGVASGSKASSPKNQQDRALNGGCGVSGSIRRNNEVRYDEGSAEAIVEAARSQIGVPYAWGGGTADGPSAGKAPDKGIVGFDCSGLTLYAAAQAGITLPRTTGAQINEGKKISTIDDAKPGDLIFWSGHVGVYSGNGKVIHAPQSGEEVREQDVWDTAGQPIIGIQRIATDQ